MDADCLAIMGCAWLRLARVVDDPAEKSCWYRAALGAIRTLSAAPYLVRDCADQRDGIITLCTYNKPLGLGVNCSTAFGDCYAAELFVEGALMCLEEPAEYLVE